MREPRQTRSLPGKPRALAGSQLPVFAGESGSASSRSRGQLLGNDHVDRHHDLAVKPRRLNQALACPSTGTSILTPNASRSPRDRCLLRRARAVACRQRSDLSGAAGPVLDVPVLDVGELLCRRACGGLSAAALPAGRFDLIPWAEPATGAFLSFSWDGRGWRCRLGEPDAQGPHRGRIASDQRPRGCSGRGRRGTSPVRCPPRPIPRLVWSGGGSRAIAHAGVPDGGIGLVGRGRSPMLVSPTAGVGVAGQGLCRWSGEAGGWGRSGGWVV